MQKLKHTVDTSIEYTEFFFPKWWLFFIFFQTCTTKCKKPNLTFTNLKLYYLYKLHKLVDFDSKKDLN